jgi:hypothetical protein
MTRLHIWRPHTITYALNASAYSVYVIGWKPQRNESIFFFKFFFVHAFFDANAGADENYAQALKEFVQASVAAFDRGYSLQVGCV